MFCFLGYLSIILDLRVDILKIIIFVVVVVFWIFYNLLIWFIIKESVVEEDWVCLSKEIN